MLLKYQVYFELSFDTRSNIRLKSPGVFLLSIKLKAVFRTFLRYRECFSAVLRSIFKVPRKSLTWLSFQQSLGKLKRTTHHRLRSIRGREVVNGPTRNAPGDG